MTNVLEKLHRDNHGNYWLKLEDEDEIINYCEEVDDVYTHEDIQNLYEEHGWYDYLDEERWEEIKREEKINQEINAMRNAI